MACNTPTSMKPTAPAMKTIKTGSIKVVTTRRLAVSSLSYFQPDFPSRRHITGLFANVNQVHHGLGTPRVRLRQCFTIGHLHACGMASRKTFAHAFSDFQSCQHRHAIAQQRPQCRANCPNMVGRTIFLTNETRVTNHEGVPPIAVLK